MVVFGFDGGSARMVFGDGCYGFGRKDFFSKNKQILQFEIRFFLKKKIL